MPSVGKSAPCNDRAVFEWWRAQALFAVGLCFGGRMRLGRITGNNNALLAGADFARWRHFAHFAGILIIATLVPLIFGAGSFAEDKPPNTYERYEAAKKFSKKAEAKCKECQSKLDKLNTAIDLLNDFDKAHPKYRDVVKAGEELKAAQKRVDDLPKKPPAAEKKAADGALVKARAADADAKQNMKDGKKGDADKSDLTQLESQLKDILSQIDTWSKALADCEATCKEAGTPPGKPPKDGPVGGGGGPKKKRECFKSEAEKERAVEKALDNQDAAKKKLDAFTKQTPDGHSIPPDENDPNFLKAVENLKAATDELKEINGTDVCPPGQGGMYFPGTPRDGPYAVMFTDSGTYCTFGRSEAIDVPVTPTDVNFDPIPGEVVSPGDGTPAGTPKTPPTGRSSGPPTTDRPTVSDTPKTPTETPKAPDQPTTTEKPPTDTPTTTERPPTDTPVTTTEATLTDDIVILFKGNQEVLERGQTGESLQGQHLMLVFKKPDLRESVMGKPVKDDNGFDKDGVHAVTGTDGHAKLKVPAEARGLYLSSLGDKPKKYYRVDAIAKRNTGSVSEIARNAKPDLTGGAPQDGNVIAEVFKIGARTFVRRLYTAAYAASVSLPSDQKDDWCRVVEPGPALGMEPEYPSALQRELPEATVKLPQASRLERHAR